MSAPKPAPSAAHAAGDVGVEPGEPPLEVASRRRAGLVLLQRHPALRRSLVVAEQLACAAAVYAVAALVWRAAGSTGRPDVVAVVAATVVVAIVLSRLRGSFERAVNWLAFGERADGYEMAAGFLNRLATSLELDDVLPRLAETAARTVGSRRGEVRVWLADGDSWRQTWPLEAEAGASVVTVPVQHSGGPVGEMEVSIATEELSPVDRRLLDELAGPAGLALSTIRLTHALRQQAADIERTAEQIQASRARIVDARRSEQARIRHQIDTMLRPDLDAVGEVLGRRDPPDRPNLEASADRVERTIDQLRFIARELFPARLAEAGLESALRGWAEQTGRRLDLSVSGDRRSLDAQHDLLAELYFCAVTAIGPAVGDPAVAIRVTAAEAGLDIELGEPPGELVVQSLTDRAEAFGGNAECAPAGADDVVRLHIRVPMPGGPGR
jgi:hypothetical protein